MSFTKLHLYFDDVEVGQEWESPGRTVTEADIVNFAGVSGDFNAIHMDHEFAKTTMFGRHLAHGMLIFSMASGLLMYAPPMRTLAFMAIREWTFKEPVFAGDTVHTRCKVLEKELRGRGRRGVITWQRRILNQESNVVQEGTTITMVETRPTPS